MAFWDKAKAHWAKATGGGKEYYVFAYEGVGGQHWKEIAGPYLTRERANEEVRTMKAGGWTGRGVRLVIKHLTKAESDSEWAKKVPSSWSQRQANSKPKRRVVRRKR